MRAIILFSFFVVLTFVIGALLAYPLKLLLDPVLDLAFRKYLNYATLISGVITCFIYLQINNLLSFNAFGFSGKCNKFLMNLFNGFSYGIAIMLIIEIILFILKIHELDFYRGLWIFSNISFLSKALLTGLLIALIEELIFRGAFFSGLYKKTGASITILFTSFVYAAVHFVRYPDLITDTGIGWLTGIKMMPDAFRRFHEWAITDYFLTLFIFGILLGLLRLKHKNIAACIGAHAGIVVLIKIANYFTNRTNSSDFDYLVSPYNSTFGWISFYVILLFTIFYFIKLKNKNNNY
jgi:membrane protease YdiL (CAAX protease family)